MSEQNVELGMQLPFTVKVLSSITQSRACDSILELSEGERAEKYVSNLAARALTFAFHRLHRPQMTSAHIKQIRPASLLNPPIPSFSDPFYLIIDTNDKGLPLV